LQSTSTSIPTINQEKMIDELKLELEIENINSKLVPYKYAIKDNYLCRVHIKNGEIKYEKLSNFIAIITEEIYEDDGTSKELVSYKVHGLNLFTMKPFPVISIAVIGSRRTGESEQLLSREFRLKIRLNMQSSYYHLIARVKHFSPILVGNILS